MIGMGFGKGNKGRSGSAGGRKFREKTTLEQLQSMLVGMAASGGTTIKAVKTSFRPDSQGCDAMSITLVLNDPPDGHDTWLVNDLWELRAQARKAVDSAEPYSVRSWFINFEREHPEVFVLEGAAEQVEVSAWSVAGAA